MGRREILSIFVGVLGCLRRSTLQKDKLQNAKVFKYPMRNLNKT